MRVVGGVPPPLGVALKCHVEEGAVALVANARGEGGIDVAAALADGLLVERLVVPIKPDDNGIQQDGQHNDVPKRLRSDELTHTRAHLPHNPHSARAEHRPCRCPHDLDHPHVNRVARVFDVHLCAWHLGSGRLV